MTNPETLGVQMKSLENLNGQWSLRMSRAQDCLKQGYRRFLLLAFDAALTADLRPRPSISQTAQALADPGVRNYDKASALADLANRLMPFSAALSRWTRSGRLPVAEPVKPMAFGTGTTVYRLDCPRQARVLKVYRRSLGLAGQNLICIAKEYQRKHELLCSLYNRRSQLVLPSHFLILNGPLLGQPAVAVVQPCIEGKKTDFYLDHSDEQLLRFFEQDDELRRQFASFASVTLDCYSEGKWCLDIVGRDNLLLVEQQGRRRLAVADCGIFDLQAIRRNALERTALFEKRIARTRRILERMGSCLEF